MKRQKLLDQTHQLTRSALGNKGITPKWPHFHASPEGLLMRQAGLTIQNIRGARQGGFKLPPEKRINNGVAQAYWPKRGGSVFQTSEKVVPTHTFSEPRQRLTVVGVEKGHKEISELLITKGADVNAINSVGDTPLHSAARAGHKDIVELLIAKGADVNAKDNQGRTPLWWANHRGHKKIVELVRKHGAKE